jgi:hypothetical protein
LDKFPEVFRRFEMDVDTDRIRSFNQLKSSFRLWAVYHWKGSDRQVEALKREAEKINRQRAILGIRKIEGIREEEKPKPSRPSRSRGVYLREKESARFD